MEETWGDTFATYLEMPCRIVAMEVIDGRIYVKLEDGRCVDTTDWYPDQSATSQ